MVLDSLSKRASLSAGVSSWASAGLRLVSPSHGKGISCRGVTRLRTCGWIIDEFQGFFNINPSVFSDMQNIWDSYRNDTKVNLLLIGSMYSMMLKIFESYHEPLFGRADAMIRLAGFGTETMKEIMHDYRPDYTNDELLALYTITGGVPKYIELLCEDADLSIEGMFDYVVRENSPFVNEGRNLLIEELFFFVVI